VKHICFGNTLYRLSKNSVLIWGICLHNEFQEEDEEEEDLDGSEDGSASPTASEDEQQEGNAHTWCIDIFLHWFTHHTGRRVVIFLLCLDTPKNILISWHEPWYEPTQLEATPTFNFLSYY
jgi:hypothetical protein